jgi:hypothetical protein
VPTKKSKCPTVPLPSLDKLKDLSCDRGFKVTHIVTVLSHSVTVTVYDTCYGRNIFDMCHTSHNYHCLVSLLVIKCVIGTLLVIDFNLVWGRWEKKLFQIQQVGVPTVPSAVIRGSNALKDFWCHRHFKVSCIFHLSCHGCHTCHKISVSVHWS